MRTRAISAIGVVVVGLIPTLLGGWAFALLMIALGVIGYDEVRKIAGNLTPMPRIPVCGYVLIALWGVAAMLGVGTPAMVGLLFLTVAIAALEQFPHAEHDGLLTGWAFAVAGSLYLGVPVFAAVALRNASGTTLSSGFTTFADRFGVFGPGTAIGLGWVLLVMLSTWIGDSGAYLVGRSLGRHKLAPVLSPKKTIEGSIGGLVGTVLVAIAVDAVAGLGIGWVAVVLLGVVIGAAGQIGDLTESLMKRQAGVKDSGALIPGHGGILDRIDALLFAFPVGMVAAWLLGVL